jgi:hypothetical protein
MSFFFIVKKKKSNYQLLPIFIDVARSIIFMSASAIKEVASLMAGPGL